MAVKKTVLKLINDERILMSTQKAKMCINSLAPDVYCGELDTAMCHSTASIDEGCVFKDAAGCYNKGEDYICNWDMDPCHNVSIDLCSYDNVSCSVYPNDQDMA